MADHEQATPIPGNDMARLAGWASLVNIVSWLLLAVPGILHSVWGWPALLAIPLSGVIALVAGLRSLIKGKAEERAAGKSVLAIFVGGLNVLLIALIIIAMIGLRGVW